MNFKSRSTRSEYILCLFVILCAYGFLSCLVVISPPLVFKIFAYFLYELVLVHENSFITFSALSPLIGLAFMVPSLAIGARRLHDINKNGWWQLLLLIPFVGVIFIIFLATKKGDASENRFGAPPTKSGQYLQPLQICLALSFYFLCLCFFMAY